MRVPFDISYKDGIESGKYTLETRDGRPVQMLYWAYRETTGKYPLLGIVPHGEETPLYLWMADGRHRDTERPSLWDLFVILPDV